MLKLLLISALLSVAFASLPSEQLRADLYEWTQHPADWQRLTRADTSAQMSFAIGLAPANRDKLEEIFWDVTNPDSPNYQKWLSFDEVTRMTDPGPAVVQPVLAWLHSVPGVKTRVMGEIIRVEATVAAVETLFQTRMTTFRNRKTGKDIIRHIGKTSVPRMLRESIVIVEGIHEFPPSYHARPLGAAGPNDAFSVNAPSTYHILYNIPNGTVVKSKASNGCFAQYAADGAPKQTDLALFDANTGTPKQTFNYNGQQDSVTGIEATLDIQTMTSIAVNANTTFFMQQNWMYVFTADLLALGSGCPNVLSISYGWNEDQQCSNILHDSQVCKQHGWNGTQYIAAVDANLVKLGAAGVTIIASSGDNGAPGDQNVDCSLDSKAGLYPAYPASSPYLLSVGATQIIGSSTGIDAAPRKMGPVCSIWKCSEDAGYPSLAEAPAQTTNASFTTGGGFSVVEAMPSYQTAAVQAYLSSGVLLPPPAKFNKLGRGYPDVSAVGQNNMIVVNGKWTVSGGTSASGPIWNGIITLLNDYLLQNNKPTLGFVNPLLYKIAAAQPSAFHTVNKGNNKCTEQACCQYGFFENPKGGWSAVTGLGSPNFGVILNYLKSNIVEKK